MPDTAPSPSDPALGAQALRGLRYPFAGIRWVLTHPGAWPYVLVPMVLNIVLFATGAWVAWSWTPWAMSFVWAPGPQSGALVTFVWAVLTLLLRALAFLVLGITLYFAAGFLAIPFNDRLSEAVEASVLGTAAETVDWSTWFGDIGLSIVHSLLALALWMVVMSALFLLNLVPGIGSLLGFPLSMVATSAFLAREMTDGCMSRRRLGFAHKLRVVRANAAILMPFGLVVSGLLWLPFLNVLMMPLAVAGGTLLFCDLEREGRIPEA